MHSTGSDSRSTPTDIGLLTLQRFERLPRLHRRICGLVLGSAARRIWEIGAGIGNVTEVLAQGNRLVLASDIRPDYVAHLRARFADRPTVVPKLCDATDPQDVSPVADWRPEAAVCISVLEHVEHDLRLLQNARTALLPTGGRLFLYVPAHQWLFCSLDTCLGHYRRYSASRLVALVETAGFEVESRSWLNMFGIAGWFLNGKVLGRSSQPASQLEAYDSLIPLTSRVETALRCPLGLNLSLVCQARL